MAEPPATVRERYVPHDCKQDDFSSGPLKSQDILSIPALGPSTNLEMIRNPSLLGFGGSRVPGYK
jgi:hypothetical protein